MITDIILCMFIELDQISFAFKLVLSQYSQILLPLCNRATPFLAVSCFISLDFMAKATNTLHNDNLKACEKKCC